MSHRQPSKVGSSSRAKRRQTSRRRRWTWAGGGGLAILVAASVVVGLALHVEHSPAMSTTTAAHGGSAPGGTFTTLSGQVVNVSSLQGRPTLLWFVSTWCSSCQAGTQSTAQNLGKLRAEGIRVDEIELYQDLGQPGPSMSDFAKTLAGPEYGNPGWTFGVSSASLTRAYDPNGYLDIYYLLDAKGRIAYVNSSPASTMPQLLAAAEKLS